MTVTITGVRFSPDGNGIEVSLEGPDRREKVYRIPEDCYSEWKKLEGTTASDEIISSLEEQSERCKAFSKALELLEYGEMTDRGLVTKLRARGFSADAAGYALDLIREKGLSDEAEFAKRAVKYYIEKKNYGRARVIAEMYRKGFSSNNINAAFEEIGEDDIDTACQRQIVRNRNISAKLSGDSSARKSAYAALTRLGFTPSEIRKAEKALCINGEDPEF